MSTTLDSMAEALKNRGQTQRTVVGGVPTMWECSSCGEMTDALMASIHPRSPKLYHGNGSGELCGPLLTPTESRHLTAAKKDTERERLDTQRAAEAAAHVCGSCGEMIARRRYPCGDLEKRKKWLAREFCDRKCGMKARKKQHWAHLNQTNPVRKGVERKRACVVCGETLVRTRWSSGRTEGPAEFNKRLTCGRTCGNKLAWQSRDRKKRGS